jgi:filamentous hemagglutinin family protein
MCVVFGLGPIQAGTITLDGSYGTSGVLTGPNFLITANMGRTMGNNLFQSFGQFDLSNGESATFSGPANIQNILARVTGGSPSSIDGSIDSTIAGANLFLINPAGVMFGAHAQVNVTGSFTVTTANYVKFNDGGIFYAQLGANDQLSSAPVSAFGFMGSTAPQPISFAGTQLTLPPGTGLHVIGGDVTLDQGASLYAPAGALTLFSAASAGEVPFTLQAPGAAFGSATNTAFGNILVQNGSSLAIDSTQGGGSVVIRGGKLVVDNATISSRNQGSAAGGSISVQTEQMTLSDAGQIFTDTEGSGNAGNVDVHVSGNLEVTGMNSKISADTESSGPGGIVNVHANTINLDDDGNISAGTDGAGNSGEVQVQAGWMSMGPDSRLSSISNGGGNSGQISLTLTGDLTMTGNSAIVANTYSPGNGGDVTVNAAQIRMSNNALISTNTASSTGAGGNIDIRARVLAINSGSYANPAGITAQSINGSAPTANAGTILVDVGSLSLNSGAVISTSSIFSSGNGGTVRVLCGVGELTEQSSINATSSFTDAGSVVVDAAQSLRLYTGSTLNTSAAYNGGDISVQVGQLIYLRDSSILAYAGVGSTPSNPVDVNGGNIFIDPEFVLLDGSLISANDLSPLGMDGNIVNLTAYFFNSDSELHATGTIETTPPDLNLGQSLVVLPANLVDAQKRLRESCARSINHEFSTLTVVGRGGTETNPDELQSDFGQDALPSLP